MKETPWHSGNEHDRIDDSVQRRRKEDEIDRVADIHSGQRHSEHQNERDHVEDGRDEELKSWRLSTP